MATMDRMQLHFSSLLLDVKRKQNAAAPGTTCSFALVADNAIAPTDIQSTPRRAPVQRTKSVGKALRRSPGPTKKMPKRALSAPMRISSCCTASRWKPDSSCDKDWPKSLSGAQETSSTKKSPNHQQASAPPKLPRRSSDCERGGTFCSALNPSSSTAERKFGEADIEWKALPPQLPSRRSDSAMIQAV